MDKLKTLEEFYNFWRSDINPITGEPRSYKDITDNIIWEAAREQLETENDRCRMIIRNILIELDRVSILPLGYSKDAWEKSTLPEKDCYTVEEDGSAKRNKVGDAWNEAGIKLFNKIHDTIVAGDESLVEDHEDLLEKRANELER